MAEWRQVFGPLGGTNYLLDCEGFYISFNPSPGAGLGFFVSDEGGPETALIRIEDGETNFRNLNGDYRSEYEKLAPKGFDACLKFYEEKRATRGSSWATESARPPREALQ